MKSRNQIYRGEGERLLKLITTYHALQYEQVLQFFIRNRDSMKSLITSLIKQGRIYYDQDRDLLCDTPEASAPPPDCPKTVSDRPSFSTFASKLIS